MSYLVPTNNFYIRYLISRKLSAHGNDIQTTVSKEFQNNFETVFKLFCFSLISMCGQFYTAAVTFVDTM